VAVWDLLVYTGKTCHDPEKGVAYHVVMKILQGLEGKGYNLFVDNWYSSPAFFIDLADWHVVLYMLAGRAYPVIS